jgi:hypothetical protein
MTQLRKSRLLLTHRLPVSSLVRRVQDVPGLCVAGWKWIVGKVHVGFLHLLLENDASLIRLSFLIVQMLGYCVVREPKNFSNLHNYFGFSCIDVSL